MDKTIAIVGASADRAKYGNKAVRAFVQGGCTVYPVNPAVKEVEGLKCYASVTDVPDPIDRISLYVPPNLVREAEGLGLNPIVACSVVNIGLRPEMFPDK